MPPTIHEAMSHRSATLPGRVTAVVVGGLLLAAASMAPASGHAVLSASTPADGETVAEPLASVRLEFNEPVLHPQVEVVGPDGTPVTDGPPTEAGDVVEQPLVDLVETGTYAVAYRVVSEDDHPVQGTFSFDYQGPVVDEPEPGAEPTPVPETTVPPDVTDPGQAPTEAEVDPDPDDGWVQPVLLVGAVVAVGVGAVLALRRTAEPTVTDE